jgi:uncharacterized protein
MATTEEVWVEMPDGVRLAATMYLPDGDGPWPSLLEALPYRKDDVTGTDGYREEYHRFADEFGYATCRLDVRGTGSSEGFARDEYTEEELDDLTRVIAWLAGRPWSNGNVGMYGTSWSGFNSLQTAMRRPPALKAICSIFASDDRYGDDVHYFGGAFKQLDATDYPAYMDACRGSPVTGGAIAGASGSRPTSHGSSPGCRTRPTTTTGSAARSARTTPRSRRRRCS